MTVISEILILNFISFLLIFDAAITLFLLFTVVPQQIIHYVTVLQLSRMGQLMLK